MSEAKVTRSFGKMETWEPPDKAFSKHVLMEGHGEQPSDGSVCQLFLNFISNTSINDAEIGSYKFGEDIEVTVGEGDTNLSEHLDNIVLSMKEGERCYVKSKLDNTGATIKDLELNKHLALKFNVQLKSISRAADSSDLEQDEKLDRAQQHKDHGTELFKQGNVEFATKRYQRALKYVLDMEPTSIGELPESLVKQYSVLKCQCYLNLAACSAKVEQDKEVVEHCTKALEVECDNIKGLFRRAQAYTSLHEFKEARGDLNRALTIEPGNKAVQNLLKNIDAKMAKEKQMYKKMFS